MNIQNYDRKIFESLIDSLNKNKLIYCVVGDYQQLPHSINHDIDLWCHDPNKVFDILFNLTKEINVFILIKNKTSNGYNIVLYKNNIDSILLMKIDLFKDTSYKSFMTLLSVGDIRKNIKPYKDFYVANELSESVMHFIYPLFEWGKIEKKQYKNQIKNNYTQLYFQSYLSKIFGQPYAKMITNYIKKDEWDQISKISSKLKRKALLKYCFKVSNLYRILLTLYSCILRFIKPSGYTLAFCGLDGAGKTTIIEELNNILKETLKSKKVRYTYWRPYCLPEIKILLGKKKLRSIESNSITINEREQIKPKNIFISFLKLLYYTLDYIIGYFKHISIRTRGGVIIYDRHYIDMIIFPQRFEMELPKSILQFIYNFVPKPDFIFFLWATPETIHQRKEEFTKDQINQQIDLYLNVGRKMKNFIPIETNKTIPEEINEIFIQIVNK